MSDHVACYLGSHSHRHAAAATVLAVALWIAGCGTPDAPQPPTLNLPEPVTDLEAQRTADTVRLTWTMPTVTTDKVPLKGPIRARICRSEGSGGCEPVASEPFAPGGSVSFNDVLPTALVTESPQLLRYSVELQNRIGRAAGPSNEAFAVAGPGLPSLAGLHAEVRRDGVLLSWAPAVALNGSSASSIRIERRLQPGTGRPGQPAADDRYQALAPEVQILMVKPGADTRQPADHALDVGVSFGQSYTYRAQRISDLAIGGHTVLMMGAPSEPLEVAVRDVFPPAVPTGIASAPDVEAHAIDLSWAPNTEQDLAGYVVYRQAVGTAGPPVRISDPRTPITAPSFRDSTPERGRRYDYTVTAVDRNGNESRPSAAVEDGLPQ